MLKTFRVKNFKNFKDQFVFDLTSGKNYEFNAECVQDGTVKNGIIYGPNGCGKTNLGYAIFDIKTHLTDDKTDEFYRTNYLNAASDKELGEFCYTFQFGEDTVEYEYTKESVDKLVDEVVRINGREFISIHREKSTEAVIDLHGAETLNKNMENQSFSESAEPLSVVKYVANSTVLVKNRENTAFKTFVSFVKTMLMQTTSETYMYRKISSAASKFFIVPQMREKFQTFLGEAGFDCKLTTMEVEGEQILAFKVGGRKIDFWKNASMGTLSMAFQFVRILFVKVQTEIISKNQTLASQKEKAELQKLFSPFSLEGNAYLPFLFIDEYDAFYHYAASRVILKELKAGNCQFILTTHNTGIMSNDLLRPDCYFIMSNTDIAPAYSFTDKELRKAHNIEKMYRAGVFTDG